MSIKEDGGGTDNTIKKNPPLPPEPYEGGVRSHPNLGPDPGQYTRNLGAADTIRNYLISKGYTALAYPQGPGLTNYFPILQPPKARGVLPPAPGGGRGGGGGGGGGGGPANSGLLIRSAEGSRLTPYLSSEPQFFGGWRPYLTVLGNTSGWG